MRLIATIGVYGFTAEAFVEKLTGRGVGLLLDLRQRRGVRGPDSASALLCVERDPEACHRSLVAARLRAEHGLPVSDLGPG